MLRPCVRVGLLATLLGLTTGCAVQNVSQPGNITLEHALVDTADALAAAHNEAKKNGTFFGLYACSVTAVFNVSATAGDENKVSLTSSPPFAVFPIGGSASFDSTASGTRGNTVTVVLASPAPACASKTAGSPAPAPSPGPKPAPSPAPIPPVATPPVMDQPTPGPVMDPFKKH